MVQVQVAAPIDPVMADGVIDDNDYTPIVAIVNRGINKGDIKPPANKLRILEYIALGVGLCLLTQWAYGQYFRPSYARLDEDYSERVASLIDVCGTPNKAQSCNILAKHLLYRPAPAVNLTASVEGK